MKKTIFLLIIVLSIFVKLDVYAKNTVISMNKYETENFSFINDFYDYEGITDGKIIAGYYIEEEKLEEETIKNQKIILVKYDNTGKLLWTYTYDKTKEDKLNYLTYSYDSNNNVDGYLMSISYNIEDNNLETVFLKIDFDGNLIEEKTLNFQDKISIDKMLFNNGEYISIGHNDNNSYLIRLSKTLDVISSSVSEDMYQDIVSIRENNNVLGYALIRNVKGNNSNKLELIKTNLVGEEIEVIKELENSQAHLIDSNSGFIVYGATKEVKLNKGDTSYYLINYNSKLEDIWETIGDVCVNEEKNIQLFPVIKDAQIKEYLLMYSNNNSSNLEIVKISADGEIKEKVKKIYDKYYVVNDFEFNKNTLYLVGQINCPKDDDCDYNNNSLLLISSEDKVIEVKDNDSKNVLIILGLFIILLVGGLFIKKKKKLKENTF